MERKLGFIDNLARRFGYTKAPQKRSYAASVVSRLTSDWAVSIRSADADIHTSLRALRARSRELAINNDYAKKYLSMCVTNIVGPAGIAFQNKAKDTNGNLDKAANDAIEAGFFEWGRKGSPSVCGKLSWLDIQRLVVKTVARDGEVLVRKVIGQGSLKFSFSLQVIEADFLDETHNETAANGNQIRMGIEFDKWGKPVAYHMLTSHPGEYAYGTGYKGMARERVPASEIIHVFSTERPGQSRGVPWMHAAMTRLNMLGGYEEAALVGARVGASKMGFFTKTGEGAGAYTGTTSETGEMLTEAEPGTFDMLPEGVDFKPWDPSQPAGEFPFFKKAMLMGAASGLNVAYNSLASDLESISYSSIRAGSIEERDNWRILQSWFIEQFCQPVFDEWLDKALIRGALGGAKPLPHSKNEKFNAPSWNVRGWQWVDPLKDSIANIDAIKMGLKTRQMVLSEQGFDLEDVLEQLKQEKALVEQYGLTVDTDEINQIYQYHIENGLVKLNEVRAKLGLPPEKGGDKLLEPVVEKAAGANGEQKKSQKTSIVKDQVKQEAINA